MEQVFSTTTFWTFDYRRDGNLRDVRSWLSMIWRTFRTKTPIIMVVVVVSGLDTVFRKYRAGLLLDV